jgi:TrmH family RNA methyltransferase
VAVVSPDGAIRYCNAALERAAGTFKHDLTRMSVFDGVQDPGNMGTILRLADWFGIQSIVCSNDTVDCYNPKVIQASMGAIFRISVRYTDLQTFLSEAKVPVYGALLNGETYSDVRYDTNGILLMGNEGNGISEALLPLVTKAVTIPRIGEAESLNVATATAILLAEIVR